MFCFILLFWNWHYTSYIPQINLARTFFFRVASNEMSLVKSIWTYNETSMTVKRNLDYAYETNHLNTWDKINAQVKRHVIQSLSKLTSYEIISQNIFSIFCNETFFFEIYQNMTQSIHTRFLSIIKNVWTSYKKKNRNKFSSHFEQSRLDRTFSHIVRIIYNTYPQ